MKKILISTLGLFACASAFAELSDNGYGGKLITGDYTATALYNANGNSTEIANIVLNGSIRITSSDNELATDNDGYVLKTTTAHKMDMSTTYTFRVAEKGTGSISLESGSTGSISLKTGMNSYGGDLTVSVVKDAGGYVYVPKVSSQGGETTTLLLDKEYAIRKSDKEKFFTVMATSGAKIHIDMSADQLIKTDLRGGSALEVTITDNANLYIAGVSVLNKDSEVTLTVNGGLENGAILFAKNSVSSGYNTTDARIVVVDGDGDLETIYVKDVNGELIKNLTWDDTLVDGYYALYSVSAVPEPAEWAMIFGALALGLAVYKRRK